MASIGIFHKKLWLFWQRRAPCRRHFNLVIHQNEYWQGIFCVKDCHIELRLLIGLTPQLPNALRMHEYCVR